MKQKRLAAEEKRFTKRITTEGDDDVKKNKGKKGGPPKGHESP